MNSEVLEELLVLRSTLRDAPRSYEDICSLRLLTFHALFPQGRAEDKGERLGSAEAVSRHIELFIAALMDKLAGITGVDVEEINSERMRRQSQLHLLTYEGFVDTKAESAEDGERYRWAAVLHLAGCIVGFGFPADRFVGDCWLDFWKRQGTEGHK